MPFTINGTNGLTFPDSTTQATRAVSRSGDTMTGGLTLGGKLDRQLTADGTAIEVRGSVPGNPKIFEVGQTSADGILYVRDGSGNASQIHSYALGTSIIRGRVSKPNQPSFEAYRGGSNQALTTSTWTTLIPNNTKTNNGGHFNTSTGVFTAPISGVYQFNMTALFYPVAEGILVDLRYLINNSADVTHGSLQRSAPAGNHFGQSASFLVYLNANDNWRLQANAQTSGVTFYSSQAIISGILIG